MTKSTQLLIADLSTLGLIVIVAGLLVIILGTVLLSPRRSFDDKSDGDEEKKKEEEEEEERSDEREDEKGRHGKERSRGNVRGAGVILIGPIPIIFGTDIKWTIVAIVLALILTVLSLFLTGIL